MSKHEVLDRIRQAEQEAEQLTQAARIIREKALAAARSNATTSLEEAAVEAEAAAREILAGVRVAVDAERTRILGTGDAALAQQRAAAMSRADSAIDQLMSDFSEFVRHRTG